MATNSAFKLVIVSLLLLARLAWAANPGDIPYQQADAMGKLKSFMWTGDGVLVKSGTDSVVVAIDTWLLAQSGSGIDITITGGKFSGTGSEIAIFDSNTTGIAAASGFQTGSYGTALYNHGFKVFDVEALTINSGTGGGGIDLLNMFFYDLSTVPGSGAPVMSIRDSALMAQSGQNCVEWGVGKLRWDNNDRVDWANGLLTYGGNNGIDWSQGHLLYPSSSVATVDWFAQNLKNDSGNIVLDWGANTMSDGSSTLAVNWGGRILYDSLANSSVDWAARYLSDNTGQLVIDWQNCLMNGNGNPSIDWYSRTLKKLSGSTTVDWENRVLGGAWTVEQLDVGGNTPIQQIRTGTAAMVISGLATTTVFSKTISVPGAVPENMPVVTIGLSGTAPSLPDGLLINSMAVTGTNTVVLKLYNAAVGAANWSGTVRATVIEY